MVLLYKVDAYILEQERVHGFFILAHNFECATENANVYLSEEFGDNYEILKIQAKLNFVNAVGEEEEEGDKNFSGSCSDPFAVAETCVPSMLMKFKCKKCDFEIAVADNGWIEIFCPECKTSRARNTLKLVDGIWVDIPEVIKNK